MKESNHPLKNNAKNIRKWIPYFVVALTAAATGAGLSRMIGIAPDGRADQTVLRQERLAKVGPHASSNEDSAATAGSGNFAGGSSVYLPRTQWDVSGVEIAEATKTSFIETIRLTGKVSVNEDRVAHIYPMVDGAVDSVSVGLGQVVRTNELLVVVHSREIGQAKLELYQARLEQEIAVLKDEMQQNIVANTQELLVALREAESITDIETRFRNRSMGDYRERLLLAYSRFLKSEADVLRLQDPAVSGAISGKQLYAAQSNRNADQATFQAAIEQIEYELKTSLLRASQAVREANTRVAVAATSLRILGCDDQEIEFIDPDKQGEAISHYSIRAPFDGTVISKDVALREQLRTDSLILSIADLSTVWITADIYEQNVPLLNLLSGQSVFVRNEAWPDRVFEATVFYTGEIMDQATRTISLRAVAKNDDRLLKPGMFVSVELQSPSEDKVLTIPVSALQEHESRTFVFVHLGGDNFEPRLVHPGKQNGSTVVILEGLTDGEPIAVGGGFILKSKMLESLISEE